MKALRVIFNVPHFFARSSFEVMPLAHRLHDAMPAYLPEWIRWGLILMLGASLTVLLYRLGDTIKRWWND
jgi:hypothetical protein